ncbi:ribosomal protein L7/L12 [Amycolatopsis lurida]
MDYGWILLAVVVLLLATRIGFTATDARFDRLDRRLTRIERKLDAVLAEQGVTLPEPELDEVRALLDEGKKIKAIKAYRELTGAGLVEAKEAVDRL